MKTNDKEMSLFSKETLDSMEMLQVIGGAESDVGCNVKGYCPVTNECTNSCIIDPNPLCGVEIICQLT